MWPAHWHKGCARYGGHGSEPIRCSPIWAGWQPRADSAPVARGEAAAGKAFFTAKRLRPNSRPGKPGPTANPANPGHTPGGSSSGSGVRRGVADGMFPVAFRTPRRRVACIRPAAYCGVGNRIQAELRHDQPHRHEDHVRQSGHGGCDRALGREIARSSPAPSPAAISAIRMRIPGERRGSASAAPRRGTWRRPKLSRCWRGSRRHWPARARRWRHANFPIYSPR